MGETISGESVSLDEFQALEQKVLRAVEIVRREREGRAAAEAEAVAAKAEAAELQAQLDALTSASNSAQTQITTLNQERESVRLRVEKMLQQMDELL
jgi:capsule polysaccharide export protein KpsE/RkpR